MQGPKYNFQGHVGKWAAKRFCYVNNSAVFSEAPINHVRWNRPLETIVSFSFVEEFQSWRETIHTSLNIQLWKHG
jgi:hypothetical protein